MRIIHSGVEGGHTKASSMPVTTAERSPTDWGFFMSLRYSHSQNTQPTTETAVSTRASTPKVMTAQTRAGTMAMMTSSMMERVVSAARMWGEEVAMSFKFL